LKKLPTYIIKRIHERDNCCQKCGNPNIEIHHIFGRQAYPNLINIEENLLGVCRKCHSLFFHKEQKQAKKWFEINYPNRYSYLMRIKNINSQDLMFQNIA